MQPTRRAFVGAAAVAGLGVGLEVAAGGKPAVPADPAAYTCDFSGSFVTFVTKGRGNLARLQVESRCVLIGENTGEKLEYFQYASCKAENTYAPEDLFQDPNYDFSGIFSRDEYAIFRTHLPDAGNYAERGLIANRFEEVIFQVRAAAATRTLASPAEIVEATLQGRPLIGRTEILTPDNSVRAILEYPIKTMNVNDQTEKFQVDTGPLAFPDFLSPALGRIHRMELAYVAWNRPQEAYFVIQRPTAVSSGGQDVAQVCHYSEIRRMPAVNQVLTM